MADSRIGQPSTFSLTSKKQMVCLFLPPDASKDEKAKGAFLQEIKTCSEEEKGRKEGCIVFNILSEKAASTKAEKVKSTRRVKGNNEEKEKVSSKDELLTCSWEQQSFFYSKPQPELEEKSYYEGELLPLPRQIVEIIIAQYLEEDSDTQLELLKHPQFFFILNALHMSLLNHVVRGEQKEAERIIKRYPEFLLKEGTVTDYPGRKIKGTALKIALGGYDADMCEMIEPYFDELPDGRVKKWQQCEEQFLLDKEESNKLDIKALIKVIDVISFSKNDQECEVALEEFRDYLKPKEEPIKNGGHFNLQLLFMAFRLYNEFYSALNDPDNRRRNLFWCKIIGYIQRFLPACYAQAFCYGFGYLMVNPNLSIALNRGLKFQGEKDLVYYPLDSNPEVRLGYEYATLGGMCYGYWNKKSTSGYINTVDFDGKPLARVYVGTLFKQFSQVKHKRLQAFVKRSEPSPSSESAISHHTPR